MATETTCGLDRKSCGGFLENHDEELGMEESGGEWRRMEETSVGKREKRRKSGVVLAVRNGVGAVLWLMPPESFHV